MKTFFGFQDLKKWNLKKIFFLKFVKRDRDYRLLYDYKEQTRFSRIVSGFNGKHYLKKNVPQTGC